MHLQELQCVRHYNSQGIRSIFDEIMKQDQQRKIRKLTIERLTPEQLETADQCRDIVAARLYTAGYSEREVTMFLAGASMLGHLQKGGSRWARAYLVRQHFTHLAIDDYSIERAGNHDKKSSILRDDPYTL